MKNRERLDAVGEAYGNGHRTSPEIARATGIPERSVRRYLAVLREDDGYTVTGATPDDFVEPQMETIEQLIKRQRQRTELRNKQENQLVNIESDRPISVTLFSDIHWGADDVDYETLVSDTVKVRDSEGSYAFCLGDLGDNWVGNLAGLSAEQAITIGQEKTCIEWWLEQLSGKLPVVVSGNHDNRTKYIAHVDYVQEMCRGMNLLYGTDMVKFKLQVGDADWDWKCRHSFKGNSQWNETHAMEKDGKLYDGWDFGASGHFHKPTVIRPFYQQMFDKLCYACNVGTYKQSDDFAVRIGFNDRQKTEYTATILYYPDGRVMIPQGATLEDSLNMLKWARKTF